MIGRATLAFLAIFPSQAALAWSEMPPAVPSADEVAVTEEAAVVDPGLEARISEEFPEFVSVAAEIAVQITGGEGEVYVYDDGGLLHEIIPTAQIAGETVWTDLVDGDGLTLVLVADAGAQAALTWQRIAGVRRSAVSDAAPDGVWQLEEIDADTDAFWTSSAGAVAALVIGRNDFPLQPSVLPRDSVPCTGFMVTQDLLITASHCLRGQPNFCEQTVAIFGYQRGGAFPLARICTDVAYLSRTLDVAVLRLSQIEVNLPTISLQFGQLADGPVAVIQHPRGGIKLVSQTNCELTAMEAEGLRRYDDLSRAEYQGLGFEHDCDTIDGSSGSPVLTQDGLVGMHLGSRPKANGGVTNVGVRSPRIAQCIDINPETHVVSILRPEEASCANEG